MRRLRYLRAGARALGIAIFTGLTAVASAGCGPAQFLKHVERRAVAAVTAAKDAGAERYAPYEYTAAAAYLHKAREEGSRAEYQAAVDFGRRAETLAFRARALAEQKSAAAKSAEAAADSETAPPGLPSSNRDEDAP